MNNPSHPLLLLFVPHTLISQSRSGIQRLVTCLLTHLLAIAEVELVTWDSVDGQMRFCDEVDLSHFWGFSPRPPALRPNRHAQAVGRRFQDLVPVGRDIVMVLPEVFYHLPEGPAIYQRVITQCLASGWPTAAVLYDLIPIQNADYASMRQDHERYVAQLLRCDYILPISWHVEKVFRLYLADTLRLSEDDLKEAGTRVTPIVLPGASPTGGGAPLPLKKRDCIVVLGTIEPRKQQIVVIRVYKELLAAGRITLPLVVVGSLHHDVAAEFEALITGEPQIHYGGYLTDTEVQALFRRARFSVFASCDEGFGLPISESLSFGVPCLTADFGAMEEVARDGGCLMVDVRDAEAIKRGLLALATNDKLVTRLQSEIPRRPTRGWRQYAEDLLTTFEGRPHWHGLAASARAALAARKNLAAASFCAGSPAISFAVLDDAPPAVFTDPSPKQRSTPLRVVQVSETGTRWTDAQIRQMVMADVLLLATPEQLDVLVTLVQSSSDLGALPGWINVAADPSREAALLAEAVAQRTRQTLVALRERNLATAVGHLAHPYPQRLLSIVISTYNRALFVAANVGWITAQLKELGPAVELVVVDNASTDNTAERLAPFIGVPGVRMITNPTNLGMLGNLKVCASLMLADHVWLIGDDDFMMPGVLRRLVRLLSVNPCVPMILMNFGVYHRAKMSAGDSPEMFVAERQLLAQSPSPTGHMRVADAGVEHDNLFTAIYPTIFRSDLAAGIFNHFFRGRPFRSLVESIPTTKFILECYADAEVIWLAEPCIVGNAHNSWQRYRVAWHAILVPLALRLARRCGMEPMALRNAARVHVDLFEEATRLFPSPGLEEEFDADALTASYQVLCQRLSLGQSEARAHGVLATVERP